MAAKKSYLFLALFLIFILCANLVNVQSARADEGTPTEPPAATQVATEPPTELPTEPPVTSTPDPVEATATPPAEAPTEVPVGTEVVVLDENGNPLPLATQEAADITEETDPMWCPAGVLPGGAGCSSNFGSPSSLISNMGSNTAFYTQNGIIYFTSSSGGSLTITSSTLTGGDFDTLKGFNLILQGGWNGNTLSPSFSGQTNFANNTITIGTSGNPWVGNLTLNDFTFSAGDQPNVNIVTSSGNITLSNVDVLNHQNGTNTAILNSTSGNITVQNGSTFDGNGSDSNGFVATTSTGSISVSNTSFTDAVRNGNNTYRGATLSAPIVTLSNVIASGNDGDGITINNANTITLDNVNSSNNGTESGPNGLANNDGSGVFVNGNPGSRLIIIGGTFNNNQEYGVEVGNPANTTIYIRSNPTCTGNDSNAAGLGCYNDTTVFDNTGPVIAPNISGTLGLNGWYRSNVSVSWSVTDAESGIFSSTGCTTSNLTSETAGTTVTCSAFNNAGMLSTASVTIKIDKTSPIISFVSRTPPNGNGWNNTDVTVSWSCSDAFSGPVATNVSQVVTSQGAGQSATGTCTDNAGNTASNTQSGINIDKTAPSLTLPGALNVEATSLAGAVVNYSASVTDNLDATAVLNCLPTSGSLFGFGSTTVNCSSTDKAGNTATGSFSVTVQDTTAPALTLPANITANATGPSGAVVTYSASASDLVDGPVAVSCDHVSGSIFPLGATTVQCSAVDAHSNTANGSFTVNIQDPDAPTLVLPANITVEATGPAGASVSYSVSATDVVDGSVPVSCDHASGSNFGFGTTSVTCSATDSSSNTNSAAFLVTVDDTTPPNIALHTDVTTTVPTPAGTHVIYSSPVTSDAVDGAGAASCLPASGSLFPIGDTQVTCTATDSHANSATSTFFVRVTLASQPSGSNILPPASDSPNSAGSLIPVTSGKLISLDCNSVFWAYGIKLSFLNLCSQQTAVRGIGADDLPGELPAGFSFVMGLNVDILTDGQMLEDLPDGSGIEMDFPLYKQSQDGFAVLYWEDVRNEWVEVSKSLDASDISTVLGTGNELYHLIDNAVSKLFYPTLTTDKTGIFVLVKK